MMTPLIDTHTHIYLEEFDEDRAGVVERAKAVGIDALLMPNVDLETVDRLHKYCDALPGFAFPMMGLHPTSVNSNYAEDLLKIEKYIPTRTYCAIGEIGIDLYWDQTFRKEQIEVFKEQLKWSIDLGLPVAIHTRNAMQETLDAIYSVDYKKLTGVFHSFTGTAEELEEINKLPNFKIGINGVVTFKNSNLSEVLKGTTLDKIVLETDAPYLAPVPYRGKRNEPSFIIKTAEKLTDTYGVNLKETLTSTRKTAIKLFNLPIRIE